MIGILNYGLGNLPAFKNAYRTLGKPCEIINDSLEIECCSHLILPGVGSFDYAMKCFKKSKLFEAVNKAVIDKKKPILGVCVGMQIMFDSSDHRRSLYARLHNFRWSFLAQPVPCFVGLILCGLAIDNIILCSD